MYPRRYALTLATIGAGLFLAVVGTNVIIDPQAVFGTGLLPRSWNANDRYHRLVAYQAEPDAYDGLFFGSSRAQAFPLEEISQRMNGVNFASFAVTQGALMDHVAVLEFVLRDKVLRGRRLRAVFLVLDTDSFGTRPYTNQTLQYLMPPPLSGESWGRFWWKNLTAIQFEAWESVIRQIWTGRESVAAARASPLSSFWDRVATRLEGATAGTARASPLPSPTATGTPERITNRIHFLPQLKLLERLAVLCREHHIELIVAASPLSRAAIAHYDRTDVASVVDHISRVVPVWDFSSEFWLSDRPELWRDLNHFRAEVARRMLDRIFGHDLPPGWEHFGRLKITNAMRRPDIEFAWSAAPQVVEARADVWWGWPYFGLGSRRCASGCSSSPRRANLTAFASERAALRTSSCRSRSRSRSSWLVA